MATVRDPMIGEVPYLDRRKAESWAVATESSKTAASTDGSDKVLLITRAKYKEAQDFFRGTICLKEPRTYAEEGKEAPAAEDAYKYADSELQNKFGMLALEQQEGPIQLTFKQIGDEASSWSATTRKQIISLAGPEYFGEGKNGQESLNKLTWEDIDLKLKGKEEQFVKRIKFIYNKSEVQLVGVVGLCDDETLPGNITYSGKIDLRKLRVDPANPKIYTGDGLTVELVQKDNAVTCAKIISPSTQAGLSALAIFGTATSNIVFTMPEGNTVNARGEPAPKAAPPDKVEEAVKSAGAFGKFDQQCILIKSLNKIIDREDRVKNFKQVICLDTEVKKDAAAITNLINGSRYFTPFVEIPNHVMAALIPKIRLFKTYTLKGNKTIDLELPLEEYISEEEILSGNLARGFGFGLESFSWENSSFNEVDRNISANLSMVFSNLDAFTKERKGILRTPGADKKYEKFKFLELIYHVPGKVNEKALTREEAARIQENGRFKIKILLGWSYDRKVLSDLVSPTDLAGVERAIKANNIVLYLFNKGHDLKFGQDGKLNVTINYQSSQEAVLNDEVRANVLRSSENITRNTRKLEIEETIATLGEENEGNKEEIKKLKEELEKLTIDSTFKQYSKFIDDFIKKGIIKIASVDVGDLVALKTNFYSSSTEPSPMINIKFEKDLEIRRNSEISLRSLDKPGTETVPEKAKSMTDEIKAIKDIMIAGDSTKKIIPYFHFGELLDLIIENINADAVEQTERVRLITGPFMYKSRPKPERGRHEEERRFLSGQESVPKNLADVPISFEYFITWFQEQVIDGRKQTYTLKNFLSDTLSKLIVQVLGPTCFGDKFEFSKTKVDINLLALTAKTGDICKLTDKGLLDPEIGKRIELNESIKNILDQANNFLEETTPTNIVQYIYLQVLHTDINSFGLIDSIANAADGIYHLRLGVDRGLVKEINFAKDDLTHMPVAIYARQGTINPGILRTPYNADVQTIGNNIFKPGSLVYIDPTYALSIPGADKTAIQEMGLGGFYLVAKTSNTIDLQGFKTSLSCRFQKYGVYPKDLERGTGS